MSMTTGGYGVVTAVPPVPQGPDITRQPIRFEKKWIEGLALLRFISALAFLGLLGAFLYFLVAVGSDPPLEVYLLFGAILLPFILYAFAAILRTRPAAFEMDQRGVRLYRGERLVKEIIFGPDVRIGVIFVGYWDDMTPGLTFRAMGMDENEFSLYERQGYGPLFGYRFQGGGRKIVLSRKYGWDIRWIQFMWMSLMHEVNMHHMQLDASAMKYLDKRRKMGLPVP